MEVREVTMILTLKYNECRLRMTACQVGVKISTVGAGQIGPLIADAVGPIVRHEADTK